MEIRKNVDINVSYLSQEKFICIYMERQVLSGEILKSPTIPKTACVPYLAQMWDFGFEIKM